MRASLELVKKLETIRLAGQVKLPGRWPIEFNQKEDLLFQRKMLPYHANGMRFIVFDKAGNELLQQDYYSVRVGRE